MMPPTPPEVLRRLLMNPPIRPVPDADFPHPFLVYKNRQESQEAENILEAFRLTKWGEFEAALRQWEAADPDTLLRTLRSVCQIKNRKQRRRSEDGVFWLKILAGLMSVGSLPVLYAGHFALAGFLLIMAALFWAGSLSQNRLAEDGRAEDAGEQFLLRYALKFPDSRLCGVWTDGLPYFRQCPLSVFLVKTDGNGPNRQEYAGSASRLSLVRARLTEFLPQAKDVRVVFDARRLRLLADDAASVVQKWRKNAAVSDAEAHYVLAVLALLETHPDALPPLRRRLSVTLKLRGDDVNRKAVRETARRLFGPASDREKNA